MDPSERRVATLSFMLAVQDATQASDWYCRALGAVERWSLGSVRALSLFGSMFLLHEPTESFRSPAGSTTVRLEIMAENPEAIITRAVEAGADGSDDLIQEHATPFGVRRAGGFRDPFGHVWIVGDLEPLKWAGAAG